MGGRCGKSIHDETGPVSYIDFNRAGVPLLEIVKKPDISTTQSSGLSEGIVGDLMYLEICDGRGIFEV